MICKKYILIIIILAVVFLPQYFVYASDTEITDKIEQQMLEKIDMSEIEKYSKDYLPDRLSFSDIVDAILAGDQKAGEKICEYIYELFFYEIAAVKPVIINVLCYTILFMVFSRLIFWRQDYVYNVSFLFMYASVISMLMASFFVLSDVAKGCIDVLLTYLTALVPAYATVLLASGKGFSASGFYMLAFVLIYVVEWLIKLVLIPGIHLFLVLEVLNHVSSEKKLEKLAEFIESAVTKIMKASIKIVAGIGIVQAMIAPAKDKISESLILKSFQAIPGVGRLGQGAGEIMLGCAMLIKTVLVWRRLSCFFHCADPACKNTNFFADVQIAFCCAAAGFRQQDCGGHRSRCQGRKSVLYRDKRCIYIVFYSDCDSMCIYKLYGRLIGHEELFVSGIFFHGNDIFNAKGAVQEVL